MHAGRYPRVSPLKSDRGTPPELSAPSPAASPHARRSAPALRSAFALRSSVPILSSVPMYIGNSISSSSLVYLPFIPLELQWAVYSGELTRRQKGATQWTHKTAELFFSQPFFYWQA